MTAREGACAPQTSICNDHDLPEVLDFVKRADD